jgi:hypothetical protein
MLPRNLDCKPLIPGCFGPAFDFAGNPQSRLGALDYLRCNVACLNTWLEIRQDIRGYLRENRVPEVEINRQLEGADNMMLPWTN